MAKKFRVFENLFNEKLEGLREEQKIVVDDLEKKYKKENDDLKKEITNLKTENNNLKNRIDVLETYDIPLSLVRGSNESKYTLTNDSVLFNTRGGWYSVFLNKIIEKVSFFFSFLMIICLRVFIIGLFIGLFIYLLFLFFQKASFHSHLILLIMYVTLG
jgi:hypothetical protein